MRSNIIASSSKLHLFYYDFDMGMGQWSADLYYKNRNLSSTSWSSATLIQDNSNPDYNLIDMSLSTDDAIHIVYKDYMDDIQYKRWSGGSWSSTTTVDNDDGRYQKIYANGNDVYVIWNDTDDETIYLKQRDTAPLNPNNLSITANEDDHPELTWDANSDTDLRRYRVYRLNGDPDYFLVSGTSYVDEDVEVSQHGTNIRYHVKAEDWSGNLSNPSNEVSIYGYLGKGFARNPIELNDMDIPKSYALCQNYPNPFNPLTKIEFNLPEDEFVSLKIYDIKGKEVLALVNALKKAGRYSVDFNGQRLSSGIYIYKIQAGNFSAIKRMLLVK